ncbi:MULTISPECIES: acyltransferase family protein [unclassified Nocardioides]|uniref:acyltransferase family protein n=1 Tax=unclassified Nocardioides TaxID=2615069 RepID=UPI00360E7DF2
MPPSVETRAVAVRARGTLPALDSMRAIAAIAVLATHASFWGGAYAHRGYGTALARLDIGVAIFFVLSGFLLSRPWFEHHAHRTRPPRARVYLWHRLLRIYPVYLVAAVAALVLLPGNDDVSSATVLHTLTLTNIYLDDRLPDGLTQMWSLATEVAFYLVLPLLMWLVLSRRRGGAHGRSRLGVVLALMMIVNVAWLVAATSSLDISGAMTSVWLPGYLTWFGVGLAIAAAAVHLEAGGDAAGSARVATALRQMGRSPGTCWVAALALFAIAATPIAGSASLVAPVAGEAVTKNLLYAASAGLLILPGVFADPEGRYIRVLSLPLLRHLGHISYGIFCVHLVILELVARWRDMELFAGRTLELFAITLVLSIAVSEVVYRVVERPALRWKRRFDRSPSSESATSTPSPASTIS